VRRLRELFLAPLHLYRRVISPALPSRCRYYPSCSTYAVEAVREYGVIRGSVLAAWRVMRCNPLSRGGFDHVHDQRLFNSPDATAGAR
jgi:putative membrane protein insertion efficiency factor